MQTMTKELKTFIKNRKLASFRVEEWVGPYSKVELSKIIGISRPTLDTRLIRHNWKMRELESIEQNLPLLQ